MPRTQVTICGAPKATAIPKIAPSVQPHEIRFAIAMPASAITGSMAVGVSQATMLACSELAPVIKGEAWAKANSGATIMTDSNASEARCRMSDLRLQRVHFILTASRGQLFPLRPAGSAEPKALDDERVVVSLLAVFVDPGVRTDLRLYDELISLARVFGDRFTETIEGDEIEAGHGLARIAFAVRSRCFANQCIVSRRCAAQRHLRPSRRAAAAWDQVEIQNGRRRHIDSGGDRRYGLLRQQ